MIAGVSLKVKESINKHRNSVRILTDTFVDLCIMGDFSSAPCCEWHKPLISLLLVRSKTPRVTMRMILKVVDTLSGKVRFLLVESIHTPGIGLIFGLLLFPFSLIASILIVYASLIFACCLCSKRRGLGLLYAALSLGCVVGIAMYAQYRCETGQAQIRSGADVLLFSLCVYGAMLIWALPIAALVKHGAAIIAGGTTFILALFGFIWLQRFWIVPIAKHLSSLGNAVAFMSLVGLAFLDIILCLGVLISPFLVGKIVWGIMDRLQQAEGLPNE